MKEKKGGIWKVLCDYLSTLEIGDEVSVEDLALRTGLTSSRQARYRMILVERGYFVKLGKQRYRVVKKISMNIFSKENMRVDKMGDESAKWLSLKQYLNKEGLKAVRGVRMNLIEEELGLKVGTLRRYLIILERRGYVKLTWDDTWKFSDGTRAGKVQMLAGIPVDLEFKLPQGGIVLKGRDETELDVVIKKPVDTQELSEELPIRGVYDTRVNRFTPSGMPANKGEKDVDKVVKADEIYKTNNIRVAVYVEGVLEKIGFLDLVEKVKGLGLEDVNVFKVEKI